MHVRNALISTSTVAANIRWKHERIEKCLSSLLLISFFVLSQSARGGSQVHI